MTAAFLGDQLLIVVMLLNFVLLGTGRHQFSVRLVAAQGVLLGLLPGILLPFSWHLSLITMGVVLVKGLLVPWLIAQAIDRSDAKQELQPHLGFGPTLVMGALCTALAFWFAARLPLAAIHQGHLFLPAAIATLLAGCLLLTTRRKAISQVLGYLVLENGIFIFGLLLTEAMPVMVEAGVLLDLLVGTFVMGIVIKHISREFASLDTSRLTALRER